MSLDGRINLTVGIEASLNLRRNGAQLSGETVWQAPLSREGLVLGLQTDFCDGLRDAAPNTGIGLIVPGQLR